MLRHVEARVLVFRETTAYREFAELANDLMHSDHATWADHFNHFFEFCESNGVMQAVTSDFRDNPGVNIEQWIADFNKSGTGMVGLSHYSLPAAKPEQGALIYSLFGKIYNNEFNVFNFT